MCRPKGRNSCFRAIKDNVCLLLSWRFLFLAGIWLRGCRRLLGGSFEPSSSLHWKLNRAQTSPFFFCSLFLHPELLKMGHTWTFCKVTAFVCDETKESTQESVLGWKNPPQKSVLSICFWIKNRKEGDGKDLYMKSPWGVGIWSLTSLNVGFVPWGETSRGSRGSLEKPTDNI